MHALCSFADKSDADRLAHNMKADVSYSNLVEVRPVPLSTRWGVYLDSEDDSIIDECQRYADGWIAAVRAYSVAVAS